MKHPWRVCVDKRELNTNVILRYTQHTLIMENAMRFGVLNLYKPLHCTSHDVVAKVRKKLGLKKVGHAGTLDPLAEGILPVCIGDATRLIEYFPGDKKYRAEVTFGKQTLSWDAEGESLQTTSAQTLTREHVEGFLAAFKGIIQQQVPPHAAVHVKGKKLYEYARKGIAVELPIRPTEIYDITLVDFQADADPDHPVAVLEIHCAGGTYIRSIAKALGDATGYGAYLSNLARTAHGQFTLEDSVLLQTFLDSPDPEAYLQNPSRFIALPHLSLNEADLRKIQHGMKLTGYEEFAPIRHNKRFLLLHQDIPVAIAIGEEQARLKPIKVFHTFPLPTQVQPVFDDKNIS